MSASRGVPAPTFQSTLPARGATYLNEKNAVAIVISIHAPRTGSDTASATASPVGNKFQSTLPARGATPPTKLLPAFWRISIHAPRTGSDPRPTVSIPMTMISIHAPRTGSDSTVSTSVTRTKRFQSTLPARGATRIDAAFFCVTVFQSTLPARGATTAKLKMLDSELFQSTLPARGATRALNVGLAVGSISIHAPRTGSDRCRRRTTPLPQYFNPRSPHGERRSWASPPPPSTRFQSTLPARGATGGFTLADAAHDISIHAPRTGSDPRRG